MKNIDFHKLFTLALNWSRGVPMNLKISFRALAQKREVVFTALPRICLTLGCAFFGSKKNRIDHDVIMLIRIFRAISKIGLPHRSETEELFFNLYF